MGQEFPRQNGAKNGVALLKEFGLVPEKVVAASPTVQGVPKPQRESFINTKAEESKQNGFGIAEQENK
jgi:hypothetical protein